VRYTWNRNIQAKQFENVQIGQVAQHREQVGAGNHAHGQPMHAKRFGESDTVREDDFDRFVVVRSKENEYLKLNTSKEKMERPTEG